MGNGPIYPIVTARVIGRPECASFKYRDIVQLGTERYGLLSCEERWTRGEGVSLTLNLVAEPYWPLAFPELCSSVSQN